MQITTFSDYALRILIYLTLHENRVSTDTIANTYGISFHHAAKAAQQLVHMGHVKSTRGRFGGISLARAPEDINIGALLRETESKIGLVDCLREDGGTCRITPACGLKHILSEARDSFFETLDQYTLVDITKSRSALTALLDETAV
jgi:Rrf2 family nitric oxide-sensitive transcriptional repressor